MNEKLPQVDGLRQVDVNVADHLGQSDVAGRSSALGRQIHYTRAESLYRRKMVSISCFVKDISVLIGQRIHPRVPAAK